MGRCQCRVGKFDILSKQCRYCYFTREQEEKCWTRSLIFCWKGLAERMCQCDACHTENVHLTFVDVIGKTICCCFFYFLGFFFFLFFFVFFFLSLLNNLSSTHFTSSTVDYICELIGSTFNSHDIWTISAQMPYSLLNIVLSSLKLFAANASWKLALASLRRATYLRCVKLWKLIGSLTAKSEDCQQCGQL